MKRGSQRVSIRFSSIKLQMSFQGSLGTLSFSDQISLIFKLNRIQNMQLITILIDSRNQICKRSRISSTGIWVTKIKIGRKQLICIQVNNLSKCLINKDQTRRLVIFCRKLKALSRIIKSIRNHDRHL